MLTESNIDRVVLPLGDVRIIARVFDVTGDYAADDIECKIWVNEVYIECPDLSEFENNIATLYYTTHERYEYILGESLMYLQFLYQDGVSADVLKRFYGKY